MQIGKKRGVRQYPTRVPRRKAIPAPNIFVPKKEPAKKPVKVDK